MVGGRTVERRARGLRLLVVALYAAVVTIAPAFHHDVACHLTSPTHCTACTATVAAPRAEPTVVFVPASRAAVGAVADRNDEARHGAPPLRIPARAPPA